MELIGIENVIIDVIAHMRHMMTKRLVCPDCNSDNHFASMKCKDCGVEL
jgi:hypothetical protein